MVSAMLIWMGWRVMTLRVVYWVMVAVGAPGGFSGAAYLAEVVVDWRVVWVVVGFCDRLAMMDWMGDCLTLVIVYQKAVCKGNRRGMESRVSLLAS